MFICILFSDGYDTLGGDSDEELSKPLTRAELQSRVIDGVKKKELEATKDERYQFDLAAQKQKSKK